ncbi:hypothetical protein RIN58_02760 [Siccibacter colletis]|uniref:gp53-like domain-containing protein n=1 Tax=Siccibacter colletis TaxID=1505757 RepID=UPI0028BE0D05|nr:hypothetical protein [Siccibacter colletis]WNN49060.1 hypothetical protein RIN58_02760 [Siccibacter colletis]
MRVWALKNLGLGEAAKRGVGTGSNQIPDMSAFSSGSDWFRLPGGQIVQTFSKMINGSDVNGTEVPFPIAFPQTLTALTALWTDGSQTTAPTYKVMKHDKTSAYVKVSGGGVYGTLFIATGK